MDVASYIYYQAVSAILFQISLPKYTVAVHDPDPLVKVKVLPAVPEVLVLLNVTELLPETTLLT